MISTSASDPFGEAVTSLPWALSLACPYGCAPFPDDLQAIQGVARMLCRFSVFGRRY
jgi:hypothetical protein